MEKILPLINERAKEWDSDAYLTHLRFSFFSPEDGRTYELLNTFYESPSRENETLMLRLMSNDRIKEEVVTHEIPIILSRPLTKNDWIYDSPEALRKFLESDQILKDLREYDLYKLSVEFAGHLDQRGIWVLKLIKPDFKDWKHYSLDPNTNEIKEMG